MLFFTKSTRHLIKIMTVTVQTACQASFLNPIIFNRQVSKCRWSQESDNGDPNGQYADYYIRSDTVPAKERKDGY